MNEFVGSSEKIENEKNIKREKAKLKKLLAAMNPERLKAVESLIDSAAFQTVQLKILRDHINEYGMSETYRHGENQHGRKRSPEADIYLQLSKNHGQLLRQLVDLLPDHERERIKEDELMSFIKQRPRKIETR